MKLLNKKICMFDFDGTIVDSMETFADVAAYVIEKNYGTPRKLARRQYIETSGIPFFQQLDILYPKNILNPSSSKEFEEKKLEGYFESPLLDGVEDITSWLRSNNILTSVSSNNFQYLVDDFVKRRGLTFDFVLGFKENFAKGRDHFEYIINKTGLSKKDMVFIGDSIKDGERAYGFGIDFVLITGIFSKGEFMKPFPNTPVIDELVELKEILK